MAEFIMNKDFGLTVAASIFTSIGLGQNDLPQMIGGMLISPLAHPIMNAIMSGNIYTNIIQLTILILTCVVIGMIYFSMFISEDFKPTERMINIANYKGRGYWNDVVYGLVAGMVIYTSHGYHDPNNINTLAGLAVGVTILPAFVNAGIMFAAGLYDYKGPMGNNLGKYGFTSSFVGVIYLVFIVVGFMVAKGVDERYGLIKENASD
jgi:uncharacterized membrane protein